MRDFLVEFPGLMWVIIEQMDVDLFCTRKHKVSSSILL